MDYSNSDSEPEETSTVPLTQQAPLPVRDSQGRLVAVVGLTPQSVALVHPIELNSDDEDFLNHN